MIVRVKIDKGGLNVSVLVIESPKVRHREDSDQDTEWDGEAMAVSEKGERVGVISNYD